MGMMLEKCISLFEPFVGMKGYIHPSLKRKSAKKKETEKKNRKKKRKKEKNPLANNPHTQSINNPPPNQLPITPHTRRLN